MSEAVLAATLVSLIAGACIAIGDYVAFAAGARLMEMLAVLPVGWDGSHIGLLELAAGGLAVPLTAAIAVIIYRSASEALRDPEPRPAGRAGRATEAAGGQRGP